MKITIVPEKGDNIKKIVYENITQFSIVGEMMRLKTYPAYFRQNVVADPNLLLGMIESLKEDLKDYKRGRDGNQ